MQKRIYEGEITNLIFTDVLRTSQFVPVNYTVGLLFVNNNKKIKNKKQLRYR
jgi:hypothetical protein